MTLNQLALVVASLAAAGALAAQSTGKCEVPGAALGITAYQSASGGIRQDALGHAQYFFNAEPVVMEVAPWSRLLPGDVIVAVGGKPITTAEGAALFVDPGDQAMRVVGDTIAVRSWREQPLIIVDGVVQAPLAAPRLVAVRVRRAGRDTPLIVAVTSRCGDDAAMRRDWTKPVAPGDVRSFLDGIDQKTIDRVEVIKGPMAQTMYGADASAGVIVITLKRGSDEQLKSAQDQLKSKLTDAQINEQHKATYDKVLAKLNDLNEGVAAARNAQARSGKFGVALACPATCTRHARNGVEFWKFEANPSIVALRGAGAMAGLMVGDVVTHVNDLSILTEEGQLRFVRAEATESMRLTVQRDGKKLDFVVSTSVRGKPRAP